MRWRWLLGGAAALILVVVAVGSGLVLVADRDAGAISPERAVDAFRDDPGVERPSAPGLPAAGVYLYRVRGEETLSRGPLSITRSFPELAPRTIRHTEDGFEMDWRLSTGKGDLSHVRVRSGQSWIVYGESFFSAAGISFTNARTWMPPERRTPPDARPGARWGGTHHDGHGLVLTTRSRMTGARTVRVDGAPVRALAIESSYSVSGTAAGGGSSRRLYDPVSGLDLRITTQSTLEQNGSAETRYTAALISLTPMT